MAVDKLVDSTQLDSDLTSVANAIRTKGGTSAQLAFPADFVSAIAAIPSGGGGNGSVIGSVTPTERVQTWSFTAPGCTYFAIIAGSSGPATDTGKCYIAGIVGLHRNGANRWYGVVSNNSGASNVIASNNHCSLTRSGDDFVLTSSGSPSTASTRCLQPGITYVWIAWPEVSS